MLQGDPGRLRQVIINLLGNAIKFTEQGEVVLTVEKESEEPEISVCISPSGTRASEFRRRSTQLIFEPFAQADGSTKRRFSGTGLGLTISLETGRDDGREDLAGERSGQGKHVSLHRLLSLCRPGLEEAPPPTFMACECWSWTTTPPACESWEVCSGNGTRSPLFVEAAGEAIAAGPGKQQKRPFGVVLLDARLPDPDGFTLPNESRTTPELAKAMVMLLSGAGQGADIARCQESGVAALSDQTGACAGAPGGNPARLRRTTEQAGGDGSTCGPPQPKADPEACAYFWWRITR